MRGIRRALRTTCLFALIFACVAAVSADPGTPGLEQPLRVGVFEAPPLAIRDGEGGWEGIGIELWRLVAERRGWRYELREYDNLTRLIQALQTGELDVTPAIAASRANEVAMDLSHSFHASGYAIAVMARPVRFQWLGVLRQLALLDLLRVLSVLFLLWVVAGSLVWVFERRANREMFGEEPLEGVGNGVWWAVVTMTSVGYGDKAPRSLGGRIVAVFWMLASIFLVAGFTATVTTSLTLEGLGGDIRKLADLRGRQVGTLGGSQALRVMAARGVVAQSFDDERDGMQALAAGRLDAFVFDELVLRYLARTEFSGRVRVLPGLFGRYNLKMAVAAGSPLREPVDRALLAIIHHDDWQRLLERYIGADD